MSQPKRPSRKTVLAYARRAVRDEYENPNGWSYDRQTVEHEILNHFDGLTNSEDDYEFIVDVIREAEAEVNEKEGVEL